MYQYIWDTETGGLLLTSDLSKFSKEPRPVYYRELDTLGFDLYWTYPRDDRAPIMWAEANNYIYKGRTIAKTKGGSLYTAPELIVLDDSDCNNELEFVDIDTMVERNRKLLETLVQESIQKVYNTYIEYQNKVDLFYVAFSGGKDSIVALDIVQRALPHDEFLVLFGDTQMEFPDTYDVIDKIDAWCKSNEIKFERVHSKYEPKDTWNIIGPPAQKMRWCCSVHKTTPQILFLRKITNNPHFRGMAMMGVRADESVTRSRYDELNYGTKHQGQYDYYPILDWNSAELFLYIYQHDLIINETYKKGNSRAGCLVCPMEAVKNSWFKNQLYAGSCINCHTTSFFNNIIINKTFAYELSQEKLEEFMNIGVWRSRHNGSKLSEPVDIFHESKNPDEIVFTIDKVTSDWREWFKTLGEIVFLSDKRTVEVICNGEHYKIEYEENDNKMVFTIKGIGNSQKEIYFISWLKIVLKKTAYCIKCQVCEANCPNGFICMEDGKVRIDDKCTKCRKCYNVNSGCVVAASQMLPKESNKMNGSIDQYKNMGIRYEWVFDYLNQQDNYWTNNGLGSMMITALKTFLRHAGITEKNKITKFGKMLSLIGGDSVLSWSLMLCNLVYTPQFNWWVRNIDFGRIYSHKELDEMLKDDLTDNSRKNVISGYKNIFSSNKILSDEIGFGSVNIEKKGKNTILLDVTRYPWSNPVPEVILYSLYKFAEACGDYYQFTLETLLDDSIERDGVSPTRIFGLDRETMIPILNGLSVNYPDFISASFTLDLDNITLDPEKTSTDVLQIFKEGQP